jgi:hypothetical protein
VDVSRQRDDRKAHGSRPRALLPLAERGGGLRPGHDWHLHIEHSQVERRRLRLRCLFCARTRLRCAEAGEQRIQRRAAIRHRGDVEAAQVQQTRQQAKVEREVILRCDASVKRASE